MSEVTIYYLEMKSTEEFKEITSSGGLQIVEAEIANFRLNKFLYQLVGESWQWFDKKNLSDSEWISYVHSPNLRTWVAYFKGSIAGYFELLKSENGSVEIAYFGLVPEFIGKGLGGYLLSQAIKNAWSIPGTRRVWVHTCTLDHPAALKNYMSRGFKIYKQEQRAKSC